jgi:hypothetical protein
MDRPNINDMENKGEKISEDVEEPEGEKGVSISG